MNRPSVPPARHALLLLALTSALFAVLLGAANAAEPKQAGAIAYYVDRYDVSEVEAKRRLELQSAASQLDEKLIDALGRGFTQAWFDNEAGRWTVALAPAGDAERARAEIRRLGLGDAAIVRRSYDYAQLRSGVSTLSKRVKGSTAGGSATVGIAAGRLQVDVASGASAAELLGTRQAAQSSAVPATIVESRRRSLAPSPEACTFPYCYPLTAGIRYWDPDSGCTAAFVVAKPGDVQNHVLTAGHCVSQAGHTWWTCDPSQTNCPVLGLEVAGYYGHGSGDAGLLRMGATPWSADPSWMNWWVGYPTSVKSWDNVQVGRIVCVNGATSGSSCGTVTMVGWSGTYTDGRYLTNMIRVANACTAAGDSGGPWVDGSQPWAVGIHSASNNVCGLGSFQIYEPVGKAMTNHGVYMLYG